MKKYLKHHPWKVIEEGFDPHLHQVSESIFSLGNGRFGIRGNFEEEYSGASLRGSYFAGVYYPDLTRVGWWKNGYPEYFAKVLNAVNWIGIRIKIDGQPLDLTLMPVNNFQRVLDMQTGVLTRTFDVNFMHGILHFRFERFCSMAEPDTAAIRLEIRSEGFSGNISLEPYLDFDVHNKDSNYGEQFWIRGPEEKGNWGCLVSAVTKKTQFTVTSLMSASLRLNNIGQEMKADYTEMMKAGQHYEFNIHDQDQAILDKMVVNLSSMYLDPEHHANEGKERLQSLTRPGYEASKLFHAAAWRKIWDHADIEIEGDIEAQQGIRFNIFHLWQTYTGEDARLNIGPKGFTGEKYGGSTYWDTEAYCIPFYLSSADPAVARNLLEYRYRHLPKAIENAQKLGFQNGAALYPMVTINGEECHNEWEITFEEIHRNGAIIYAIYDYIRYTGDISYIVQGGLEVIIAVARFWAQRVNFSHEKQAYVILGVTGPNEYENNVNNNWYTNYIARWCLQYAIDNITALRQNEMSWQNIQDKTNFRDDEISVWQDIIGRMYFPRDEKRQVFLQQDGFLDKELMPASEINGTERPIHQHWSWDRILRSCFIKQADVLQGMYFFEDQFDADVISRHFDFYEPMTVHESSLSPCVHAILAAHLGKNEKALEMYLRTARLDLDDYNNDTEDGLHITSMAGTWMAVVRGFAGLAVRQSMLCLDPVLPLGWKGFKFKIRFRGRILQATIADNDILLNRISGDEIEVAVNGIVHRV